MLQGCFQVLVSPLQSSLVLLGLFGPCPVLQQTKLLRCFLPCCSLNDHWSLLVGRRRLHSPLCGFWAVFPCRVSDSVLVVIPAPACKESTFRPWSVLVYGWVGLLGNTGVVYKMFASFQRSFNFLVDTGTVKVRD